MPYNLVLFLHVVGAMGLFGAIALELLTVIRLRKAATIEHAVEWLTVFGRLRFLYGVSLGTILLAGLYLTSTSWGWTTPWIDAALSAMLLLAAVGGVLTGVQIAGIDRALGAQRGTMSDRLRQQLRNPRLWISVLTRAAIALGNVFLMTVKPDLGGSLLTIVTAVALGLLSAALTLGGRPASEAAWAAHS